MSSGVRSRRMMGRVPISVSTVKTAAITSASTAAPKALLRTPRISPAPKSCATGMLKPEHAPSTKPMIRKLTEPVEPTAAKAFTPRYRPTMMLSAML